MGVHHRTGVAGSFLTAAVALTLFTACTAANTTPASSSSQPTSDTTSFLFSDPPPTDDATDTDVPWDSPTSAVSASDDSQLTITGLRQGSHDGYDRVVIEFTGDGTPGWLAVRSSTAVEDPTGATLDLPGEGYLELVVSGLDPTPDTGLAANSTADATGTAIVGAEFTGVFEGETQVWLGLSDPEAPYRVFTLAHPTRLVVDVQQ